MFALVLPESSPVINQALRDVALPPEAMLSAILRDGRPLRPHHDDIFRAGDELLFLVADPSASVMDEVAALFDAPVAESDE